MIFTPCFDQEPICRFVVWAFGQFGFGQGAFEVAVKFLAPGVHFGPRQFDAFDGVQAVAVRLAGMVGDGRDNAPESGGGTELYGVIGHAPRHLYRNVTLLGRVVQGMELLSALP